MTQKNNDKLALIAGVENVVGAAVASKLQNEGWKVIGFDVEPAANIAKGLDLYLSLDMTNRKKFVAVVSELEKSYGEINSLICATGFEADRQCGGFLETSMELWQSNLDGWLRSSINACFAVAPEMVLRKAGKIMILAPDYAHETEDHVMTAVGAGTLHGFAKSFGVEMAKENVLVNCLWPNTPFDLDAIASMVHFLSDSANYVSAQVVSIRGLEQEVTK